MYSTKRLVVKQALSFNDGYGFVTEKVNSCCFKLYRVISSRSVRQTSANGVEF